MYAEDDKRRKADSEYQEQIQNLNNIIADHKLRYEELHDKLLKE